MSYGFVYYLENETMPGLVKIGFTKVHPMERAKQLSANSGVAQPFTVLAYFGHERPSEVERMIHADFAQFRVNHLREFFRVPYRAIQQNMRCYSDEMTDAFYSAKLDHLTSEEVAAYSKKGSSRDR